MTPEALSKSNAGFTLIELILTALIIMVIAGLSVPVFKASFADLRVNLQAKDMAGLMKLAKERAIMTRIPHLIKIDKNKNTYKMFILDIKKDKTEPVEGRWGRAFHVWGNIKIENATDVIKFFPDGACSEARILFKDASGLKSRIDVNAKTGEITVGKAQE
jgi:Tfp pilus assembly protein FimT